MQIIAYYLTIQQIVAKTDRYLWLSKIDDVVGKQTNHLRLSVRREASPLGFICATRPKGYRSA